MVMGYHQVENKEEHCKYTAFVTPFGQFEYTRVPFGLTNAPRAFQRIIYDIIGHLTFVIVFLDDILIFSKSRQEHYHHLKEILELFKKNNISINFEKSKFFKDEVVYLGHVINKDGIKADISNLQDFRNHSNPTTVKQLQRLLGIINWFRPFIPNLSNKICPLTSKLHKGVKFQWSEEDSKIVDTIFDDILKQQQITYPDFTKPFNLETDASDNGVGAVLYQTHGVIGFYSAKFSPAQRRYTVMEKELMGIILALQHFKQIIFLSSITVYTDNSNIITEGDLNSNRVHRWKIILQEFDITLKYKAGNLNTVADSLSRCFSIRDQINDKCNIAEDQIQDYLSNVHETLQHPGINSALNTIGPYIKIPDLKQRLLKQRRECQKCQETLQTNVKYGKITGTISTLKPMKEISSDIFGPMDASLFKQHRAKEKIYFLTITDRCTRWTEVYPIKMLTSEVLINEFKKWIIKNGKPETLLTDQGRQYISKEFKFFLVENNITHYTSCTYNPTGNSISERLNQTIAKVVRLNKQASISSVTNKINWVLQNTYSSSLKASPHEVRFGVSNYDPLHRNLTGLLEQSIANVQLSNTRQLDTINKKRKNKTYTIGDTVYYKIPVRTKFDYLWAGPYKVKGISTSNNNLLIASPTKEILANIKQVRPA